MWGTYQVTVRTALPVRGTCLVGAPGHSSIQSTVAISIFIVIHLIIKIFVCGVSLVPDDLVQQIDIHHVVFHGVNFFREPRERRLDFSTFDPSPTEILQRRRQLQLNIMKCSFLLFVQICNGSEGFTIEALISMSMSVSKKAGAKENSNGPAAETARRTIDRSNEFSPVQTKCRQTYRKFILDHIFIIINSSPYFFLFQERNLTDLLEIYWAKGQTHYIITTSDRWCTR